MNVTDISTVIQPPARAVSPPPPVAEAAVAERIDPTVKGGARGLALLSGDAAAVVLAEQGVALAAALSVAPSDLRARDLRQVDLKGIDLRGADLRGSNLSGKDLTGLDLSGATLTDTNLEGANLTGANLNGVIATEARFDGAMFLGTRMNEADFSRSSFKGAYFGGVPGDNRFNAEQVARMGKTFDIDSSTFTRADFTGATFVHGSFNDARLDGAKFDKAGFGEFRIARGSTATDASFEGMQGHLSIGSSDVSGAKFRNINRSGTEGTWVAIGQSKVDGVSFAGSTLVMRMSDVDLRKVDMNVRGRDLRLSIFNNVKMTGMDFRNYDFSDASFINSGDRIVNDYLDPADRDMADALDGTDFRGAKFDNTNMYKFDLRRALTDSGALDGAGVIPEQAQNSWISRMLQGFEDFRRQMAKTIKEE